MAAARGGPGRRRAITARDPRPFGLILAGGQARRMGGGDKPLRILGGRPLLAHVIAAIREQCRSLAINAPLIDDRWQGFGLPVLPDMIPGGLGPLAGIATGLGHLREQGLDGPLLTVSGDSPFLPVDLAERLEAARAAAGVPIARAVSAGRSHPVIALWSPDLRDAVAAALAGGDGSVGRLQQRVGVADAVWPVVPRDPFLNINRPDDLAAAEGLL